VVIVGVYR